MEKELEQLKKKADRLVKKCDRQGYEFTDLEIGAIKNIAKAETMKDINWLALNHFERTCDKLL